MPGKSQQWRAFLRFPEKLQIIEGSSYTSKTAIFISRCIYGFAIGISAIEFKKDM